MGSSTKQPLPFNPSILVWARERCGMSREEAASKVNVVASKVASWEAGESAPTARQARLLAKACDRPFLEFFADSIRASRSCLAPRPVPLASAPTVMTLLAPAGSQTRVPWPQTSAVPSSAGKALRSATIPSRNGCSLRPLSSTPMTGAPASGGKISGASSRVI